MSRPVPKPTPPEQITISETVEPKPKLKAERRYPELSETAEAELAQAEAAPIRALPPFHPAADLFPLLPDDSQEFKELVADIRAHGLHDTITMIDVEDRPHILDGRNRARALQALGASLGSFLNACRMFDGTDPFAFVLSQNLYRRHLTGDQRAEVLAKLRDQGMSVRAIAEKTKVPKSTVARDLQKAKSNQVSRSGTPEPKPADVTQFLRDPLPPPVKPIGPLPPPSPPSPATPKRVTGRDGKSYAASKPPTVAEKFEKAVEAAEAKASGTTATGIGLTIVNGLRDLRRASQALKLVDAYGLVGALGQLNQTDRQRSAALKVIADLDDRMRKFRMALSETDMHLPQR